MYFIKIPKILKLIFTSLIWDGERDSKNIYLTFDDGPNPESTKALLNILNKYNAKATFFCSGEKVELFPEIISDIQKGNHEIGNHGYSHPNGWSTKKKLYVENVKKCSSHIKSDLFRPPYGKITFSQIKQLKKGFKIIMWSLMPGDFDKTVSKETCLQRSIQHTIPGTIIVFHDTTNTIDKLKYILPEYIQYFQQKGYEFKSLNF